MNRTEKRLGRYVRGLAGPLFVLGLLLASLWLLHRELRDYHLRDILNSLVELRPEKIELALALTLLSYLVLFGYDLLGLRYIRHSFSLGRVALASFLGCAVGNNFGTLLGGSTVRLRLYTAWGLSAVEVVKLTLVLSITFWLGVFTLSGIAFIVDPLHVPSELRLPVASTLPLGVALGLLPLGYLVLCGVRRSPLAVRQWEFSPPSLGFALVQQFISVVDLMLVAAVLFVLLPPSLGISYFHFLAVYLLALVAGLSSQVPGGLGVFDALVLVLLSPSQPQQVVGALLAFRLIYYLLPLFAGLLLLGVNEVSLNRRQMAELALAFGKWVTFAAPGILALTVFLAGVMLLFSGATPAAHSRLTMLREVLPLPVVELSHFLGSVVGILLVLLARGLQRRIEAAYYVTTALLTGGIVFSLLKGFDYEEAAVLTIMLGVFLPSRPYFYRKGALLTERFTPAWYAAIALVIASTLWLMLFSYKHVEYNHELWWQFAFHKDAPRSLRALAGVALVALFFGASRLLRAKSKPPGMPTPEDLAQARRIVADSPCTSANLALLGDKRLLFNQARTAFIMYGIEGRSWVSMGDPVGSESAGRELIWDFRELCDEGGRWPVFYQIDQDRVPMYVEMGLTLIKLGEEARVPLREFGLEGRSRKGLRHTNRQLAESGCTFEIVDPPIDESLLGELKRISNAWLAEKSAAEKGFSLGFFQPEYIRRGPVALVRRQGKLVAFANVWRASGNAELSIDLMRYEPDAPHGVMEFLFIRLMLWGKEYDYQWFNLGMAPLSGVEAQPRGPIWNQIASLAYRHGEHFYNFQGLRQYKDKFDPVWSPKYLASPGGLALPIILTNVATLISGGLTQIVRK